MKTIIPGCLVAAMFLTMFSLSFVVCCGGAETSYIELEGNMAAKGIEKDDKTDINANLLKADENLSLPDEYPQDVIPLLDDAKLVKVNHSEGSRWVTIIFTTGKSFDSAVAFYKSVLKDGRTNIETEKDNSYMLVGSKADCNFTITIGSYEQNDVSIMIDVSSSS